MKNAPLPSKPQIDKNSVKLNNGVLIVNWDRPLGISADKALLLINDRQVMEVYLAGNESQTQQGAFEYFIDMEDFNIKVVLINATGMAVSMGIDVGKGNMSTVKRERVRLGVLAGQQRRAELEDDPSDIIGSYAFLVEPQRKKRRGKFF